MRTDLAKYLERLRRAAGPGDHNLVRQVMVRRAQQFAVAKPVKLTTDSRLPTLRAAADGLKITGLAIPYNKLSIDMGGFREVYTPGCFAGSLNDGDLRVCFSHNVAYVLGRKSAGTATFWEDSAGVHFEADPPDTSWANDLLTSMDRGDIDQASAAFFIQQHRWEQRSGERVRVVEKGALMECSVVAFAAYGASTAATAKPGQDQSMAAGSFYATGKGTIQ